MRLDQNKRALLTEAVIAAGLIAIGIPAGQVPLAVIVAAASNVGGNWAYSLTARGFQHWYAGWFTDDGVLNNDIEKVLYQAYVKVIKQLELDWKPHYEWLKQKNKEEAEATVYALSRLRKEGANLLRQPQQLSQVTHKEQLAQQAQQEHTLNFLYQDGSMAGEYLKQKLREYLDGYNEVFISFVSERLGPEWILRFVEILKDPDSKEGTRAWRACQLLWQKCLMLAIEQIKRTTDETADAVHWIQEWANELKSQPIEQRNPIGQDALEKILYSVYAQLDKIEQTLDMNYAATLEIKARVEQMYQQMMTPAEKGTSQVWNVPSQGDGTEHPSSAHPVVYKSQHKDWGEAPEVNVFFGRTEEYNQLKQWIVQEQSRLVALVGMGGVGKTSLSVTLGQGGIGKTKLTALANSWKGSVRQKGQ